MDITCLDENQAIHFIKGRLPADLAQQIDLHILSCPKCVDLILDVTAKHEQEDGHTGPVEASTQEVPPPLAGGQSVPPHVWPIKRGFSQELSGKSESGSAGAAASTSQQGPVRPGETAPPPSPPPAENQSSRALLGILIRRHRILFVAGGLALLALVAALIVAVLSSR